MTDGPSKPLHTARFPFHPFRTATLATPERNKLERFARKLPPGRRLVLIGHTDDIGPEHYNLAKGLEWAKAVAAVLIEAGVDRDRISVFSRGYGDPIGDNETMEGRALNRRVEIRYAEESEAAVVASVPPRLH